MITSKQNCFTCICCKVIFETASLQREHFKSEWHLYNLKRKVCNLVPLNCDDFSQIIRNKPPSVIKEESNDSDWEDVYEEDCDEDELVARAIKDNNCLFCDKKSASLKSSLKHMNLAHGFFIPEERYVIDLEGLMEYLGFKVGVGSTCLWCNKEFSTTHGARLHMIYKDHCKIYYNQENAVGEFKEFYDYSTQEKFETKKLSDLIPRPRREIDHKRSITAVFNNRQCAVNNFVHYKPKSFRKFDTYRAKMALRTYTSNNNTMRGRLRQQNPI